MISLEFTDIIKQCLLWVVGTEYLSSLIKDTFVLLLSVDSAVLNTFSEFSLYCIYFKQVVLQEQKNGF